MGAGGNISNELIDFYKQFKPGVLDAAGIDVKSVVSKETKKENLVAQVPAAEKEKKRKKDKKKRNKQVEIEDESVETEDDVESIKTTKEKLTAVEKTIAGELLPVVSVEKIEKNIDTESEEYKRASIEIYRALLMLGEVPFLERFLVRGEGLSRVEKLDFCVEALVQHGVDTEMKLSTTMTGEDEEIKEETKSKILDLRAYVLGTDKTIEPKAKEWLEGIGVDEVRLKSIKDSVDEKYPQLFEEEEELYRRSKKEIAYGINREFVEDNKSFYNPIDDLKIAYDLVEDGNGFVALGEITKDSSIKDEARKRLEENEYNLSIVEENGIEAKRDLALRIAAEINSLLSIYVESWVKSNGVLSEFMGVNAERLKKERVEEEKKIMELGEVSFYDNMFEDLYLSVLLGDVESKQEAIDRLREHGIKPKQYDKNSEESRLRYLEILKSIVDGTENKRKLEWQIIKSHKLNNSEEFKQKYADLIDSAGEDVEREKTIMYQEVFEDLWVVENGSDEEKVIAMERLKNNGIKVKTFLDSESSEKADYQYALDCIKNKNYRSWRGGEEEVKNKIKGLVGIAEKAESDIKVINVEKVEKVPVWDDEVLKFLDEATKDKNSREKKSAFEKKLKVKGFVFKEKNPEEDEKLYAAIDACLLNKGNEKHKNPTVALAYLKEYFGVVEGERDENKENLEKKIKDLVDKKDRFGLSEMMAGGTDEKLFNWAVGIMTGGKLNEEFPTSEKAWEYFKAHIKMGGLSGETEKTKDSGQVEAEQPVWYPEVLDDLDIGTLDEDGVDSVKKQKAVKRLLGHGIDLSKHKSWKRLKEAFDSRVKYGDRFYGKFKSKKEAGDYILKSFGVVKPTVAGDVKVEFSEDTLRAEGDFVEAAVEPVVVPEVRPVVVERNPIRRLELMCDPTKWQQVMNIVENSRTEEEKKKHKLALRALIFQLEHPEERVNTRGRWETLYIPYLRQLGVEESKLV